MNGIEPVFGSAYRRTHPDDERTYRVGEIKEKGGEVVTVRVSDGGNMETIDIGEFEEEFYEVEER